eukprot:3625319-Amphidinium_carterae.1
MQSKSAQTNRWPFVEVPETILPHNADHTLLHLTSAQASHSDKDRYYCEPNGCPLNICTMS